MDFIRIPFCKKLSPEEIAYLKSLTTGLDRQIETVAEYIGTEEFAALQNMNQMQIDAFFRNSGIKQKLDDLIAYNASDSEQFIRQFYKIGSELGYENIGGILAYTQADRIALYNLTTYNFNLVTNLNTELREGIREVIFNAVASGDGYQVTMRNLMELPLSPINNNISVRTRAEMIARTEHARAVNTGTLQAYVNYGVTEVEIITAQDDLVCDDCIDAEENNPHSIVEAQNLLPMHPNCYDMRTKVFTDNGWKYFKDITEEDKLLSLNPQTNEIEFIDYVKIIEVKNIHGFMYHIHNRWFDICVTPDHDCFIHQRKDGGKRGRYFEPQFRKPSELNSESYFVRCVDTDRENPKHVNVNGLEFTPEDYAFFMAWYISEGSVLHNHDTAKSHGYPIKITQEIGSNREVIQPIFEKICSYLDIKLAIGKNYFELYNKRLYEYLVQLGRSHEKYIPKELFTLNKECLNIFLDNYILGDGHERKPNNLNSIERTLYTSSPRLKDDLSYLVLLCGYYPSVYIHTKKGTVTKHKNGEYIQNHNVYRISINNSSHSTYSGCTVDKIPYNENVYCVELPKWHTLWIMRNGKTSWNGNCRCAYAPVVESVDDLERVENPMSVDLTD